MRNPSAKELSRAVNAEARRQSPNLTKFLGMEVLAKVAPRLALRCGTEYPYSFTEAESLIPTEEKSFGRVVRRGRQEGLSEVHSSIGSMTNEHNWLFIPDASLWIDATLRGEPCQVISDEYAYMFLSHLYPEIHEIHTHPDLTVKQLTETRSKDFSDNYLLEAAQPSGDDIVRYGMMRARNSAACRQHSTVVSHYGATSFSLSGELSQGFQIRDYDRRIEDASDPVTAIRRQLGRMSMLVQDWNDVPIMDATFLPLNEYAE